MSARGKVGRVTHRAGTTMRYVSADNSDTVTIVSQSVHCQCVPAPCCAVAPPPACSSLPTLLYSGCSYKFEVKYTLLLFYALILKSQIFCSRTHSFRNRMVLQSNNNFACVHGLCLLNIRFTSKIQ